MSLGALRPGDRLLFGKRVAKFIRYSKTDDNCLIVKFHNCRIQKWHESNFTLWQPIMPDNRDYYESITKGE